jgi:hypothetical protein
VRKLSKGVKKKEYENNLPNLRKAVTKEKRLKKA